MQENGNNRGHYTQITKLEALFSPAEGWPLSLSAIPPSRERSLLILLHATQRAAWCCASAVSLCALQLDSLGMTNVVLCSAEDPAVQGIVILREQGITVLSLQQLLAARKFDVAAQTAIGWPQTPQQLSMTSCSSTGVLKLNNLAVAAGLPLPGARPTSCTMPAYFQTPVCADLRPHLCDVPTPVTAFPVQSLAPGWTMAQLLLCCSLARPSPTRGASSC